MGNGEWGTGNGEWGIGNGECFENGKILVCRGMFFSDNLLASLTKLVAAATLENHVKIYITFTTNRGEIVNLTGFRC